ncbi:MAG: undecaprenyl-diphosphate phosphatase [Acidimicrobiales bacterium]|nr:undecaprenyl-diphosphate phosphatase [Acidimicrobiales bacterium]
MIPNSRSRQVLWLLSALLLLVVLSGTGVGAATSRPENRIAPSDPTAAERDTAAAGKYQLGAAKAVVLGLVEGVTEYLPISSTGHLLVAQRALGITSDETDPARKQAADAYAIVIQGGAILAVLILYWRRAWSVVAGFAGRDEQGRRLGVALAGAFAPAAVIGITLEGPIKDKLFGPWPVIVAWAFGGVVLLVLSSRGWLHRERHASRLEEVTLRQALIVGAAQCVAMWPGVSRSLVTIVAAILVGLSVAAAVEFSFLLGLITLGGATAFDAMKHGSDIVASFGAVDPMIGFVAALVAALVAVKWMVGYLQSHSLAIFGWYRLAAALLTVGLLLAGIV